MNNLGSEEWEIVNLLVTPTKDGLVLYHAIFKRPKP
jgi:hypothetical protein